MIHTQGDLFCVAVKCSASLCLQLWSHSFSTVRSVFSFLQLSSFTVLLVCVCQKSSGLQFLIVEFLLCWQSVLRFVSVVLNSQSSNCQHCDHIPVIAHCCSSCTRFVWSMVKFEVSDCQCIWLSAILSLKLAFVNCLECFLDVVLLGLKRLNCLVGPWLTHVNIKGSAASFEVRISDNLFPGIKGFTIFLPDVF